MRIAIFGSYNSSSIGDSLILSGLISALARILPVKSLVTVYHTSLGSLICDAEIAAIAGKSSLQVEFRSIRARPFRKKLGSLMSRLLWFSPEFRLKLLAWSSIIIPPVKEDYLIIGGGNLLMDLSILWPYELNRIVRSRVASSCAYCFLGVGAGPIQSSAGKKIISKLIDGAAYISFRDKHSYCEVHKISKPDQSYISIDLAFGNISSGYTASSLKSEDGCCRTLGINIASVWGDGWPYQDDKKYWKMIGAYALLIQEVLSAGGYETLLFVISNLVDVKASMDLRLILNDLQCFPKIKTSNYESESPFLMREALDSCNVFVGTRLHACIAALLSRCPVTVALSYQPKVKDVLKSVDPRLKVYDLNVLVDSPERVAECIVNVRGVSERCTRKVDFSWASTIVDSDVKRCIDAVV